MRRRDLWPTDIVERRGLRVTSLPLTVVEAAVRRGGGAKLMDSALQRHVELRDLWRVHIRNKGRYGSPAARILLQAAADGARSAAERLLVKLLKEARITGWKANHPVGRYVVDVAFPHSTLAIETDGWAFHHDQEDFQKDRVKQNEIALLGWQVLRFTWLDLTEYPQRVITEIRSALSSRAGAAASSPRVPHGDRPHPDLAAHDQVQLPRRRAGAHLDRGAACDGIDTVEVCGGRRGHDELGRTAVVVDEDGHHGARQNGRREIERGAAQPGVQLQGRRDVPLTAPHDRRHPAPEHLRRPRDLRRDQRQVGNHDTQLTARAGSQRGVIAVAELVEGDHAFGDRTFQQLSYLRAVGVRDSKVVIRA